MAFRLLPQWLRGRRHPTGDNSPLARIALVPPFDAMLSSSPPLAAQPPSMMSLDEQRVLQALAHGYYEGRGCIVDAGIFLGASTVAFSNGLRANPRFAAITAGRPRPIIAIDKAVVTPTMLRHFKRCGIGADLTPGVSYSPLLRQTIAPVQELVELRIGDINQIGIVDDAIELLFLDVIKNPAIGRFAVENYFPRLIPGRSVVIQQDYFFDSLEFIKVHQEFFADHFEPIGEVASSALLRCRAPITAADLARFAIAIRDPDTQIALATAAIARTADPARQVLMAVSKLRLIAKLRGVAAARVCLAELEHDHAALLQASDCPVRVLNSVHGARYLCASTGDRAAQAHSQRIAFGLAGLDED